MRFQNNTINGIVGEAFVITQWCNPGSMIDQNTFINVAMNPVWYRGQNNLSITNNLFYNTKCYGQSTYDINGVKKELRAPRQAVKRKKRNIRKTLYGLINRVLQ